MVHKKIFPQGKSFHPPGVGGQGCQRFGELSVSKTLKLSITKTQKLLIEEEKNTKVVNYNYKNTKVVTYKTTKISVQLKKMMKS